MALAAPFFLRRINIYCKGTESLTMRNTILVANQNNNQHKRYSYVVFSLCLALLFPAVPVLAGTPGRCSYQTYQWNTRQKRAVHIRRAEHAYGELKTNQVDAGSGCSVCEQDQAWVKLPGVTPFRLCRHVAKRVEKVLTKLIALGFPIHSAVGYRVGMTRGPVDNEGNRTRFSNHSFGIALDINSQQNGLYDRCITFGPQCRLIRGGAWQPGRAGTLRAGGPMVTALQALGLHWGGEIAGRQKDFMHFSPSGY